MKQTIIGSCNTIIENEELNEKVSIPCIWISTKNTKYRLYTHKLRYIETKNRYLVIHYGNEHIFYNGKLKDFQNHLPNNFFRCNNSYIVNANYIEKIQTDVNRYILHLISGENVPLSRKRKKALIELIYILYINKKESTADD